MIPSEIRTIRKARVPAPTIRDVAMLLFRRKRIVLLLFCGILLATFLCVLSAPRSYVSEMQILVNREPIDPSLLSDSSQLSAFGFAPVTAEGVNSEVELLRGRELLANIVQACGLENQEHSGADELALLTYRLPRQSTPHEVSIARATQLLKERLDVEPLKGTHLIRVAYTSPDRASGTHVLHAAAALLEEKNVALHRQSNSIASFGRQADRYRDALANAEQRLADFDRAHSSATLETQKQTMLLALAQLETVLQQNQAMAFGSEQRTKSLREEAASLPDRHITSTKEGDNAALLSSLRDTLLSLQLKRSEMLQKYAPAYPLVQANETEIAQTRVAIAQAEDSPVTETTTDLDPTKEWIATELAKTDADRAAFKGEAEFYSGAARHYQEVARKLDQTSLQREDLVRKVKIAEDDYFLYRREAERALIADATGSGNVSLSFSEIVTTLAHPPLPFAWILIGCSLAAGIVSLGAAYAVDRINPFFHTPEEVSGFLDVKVLASIPVSDPRL